MSNKELLDLLMSRETDYGTEVFTAPNRTYNAQMVKKYLPQWNMKEGLFPVGDVRRYVRLNEWSKDDFDIRTEMILRKYLPAWFMLVYIKVKQFKSQSRSELSSTEEAFAKLMGYPINTQEEKAFVTYEMAYQKYINEIK